MIYVSSGNGNSSESKSKERKSNQAIKSIHATKPAARMHACTQQQQQPNERTTTQEGVQANIDVRVATTGASNASCCGR